MHFLPSQSVNDLLAFNPSDNSVLLDATYGPDVAPTLNPQPSAVTATFE